MLSAYFDDSGTHSTSRVVAWGGFVGDDTQWKLFDRAWRAKLGTPLEGKPRLRKFALADCQSAWGEFTGYSRAESDLLQNEMRQIIVDHKLLGVAFGIDKVEWDRLVVGAARDLLGDAESVCFGECFAATIERARAYGDSERSCRRCRNGTGKSRIAVTGRTEARERAVSSEWFKSEGEELRDPVKRAQFFLMIEDEGGPEIRRGDAWLLDTTLKFIRKFGIQESEPFVSKLIFMLPRDEREEWLMSEDCLSAFLARGRERDFRERAE